jgi:hypothetical protein
MRDHTRSLAPTTAHSKRFHRSAVECNSARDDIKMRIAHAKDQNGKAR